MAGDPDRARDVWARGNATAGPSADLLAAWARRELRAGGAQARRRARELLAQALAMQPGHAASLRAAAALEDRAGGVVRAEAMYREALGWARAGPSLPPALFQKDDRERR